MYQSTVGHDVELFLTRNGQVVSAIDVVPGTKQNPYEVAGGAVQCDNVLAELNIVPATTVDEFITNTLQVQQGLLDLLQTRGSGYDLEALGSWYMDEQYLCDPRALVFGCEPDISVWTREYNIFEGNPSMPLRSAGGHIHKSLPIPDEQSIMDYVVAWECTVGLGTLHRENMERRSLYGKSGSFRPKEYGVEIRSPSNFWMATPEDMARIYESAQWLGDNTHTVLECLRELKISHEVLQTILDTGQVQEANEWRKLFPQIPGGY